MIERLKEIRDSMAWCENLDGGDALDKLIDELEAKEAAQTPKRGQVRFYETRAGWKLPKCSVFDLNNVIIHEGDISNGKKWFAISGILIEKE